MQDSAHSKCFGKGINNKRLKERHKKERKDV